MISNDFKTKAINGNRIIIEYIFKFSIFFTSLGTHSKKRKR